MKGISRGIVTVVAVMLLVTGCSASAPLALVEGDTGRSLTLQTGEEITVELPSNPTTGFEWTIAELGPLDQLGDSTYDTPQEPGIVGQGGTETFRFKAGESGEGDLKLEYRRPWEADVAAEQTWSVKISVR